MTTLPAVPKVVRLDFHFTQGHTANLQTREFFQYSGSLSNADAITWCAAAQAAMSTMVAAQFHDTVTHWQTVLTDLTSVSSPQIINATQTVGGNTNTPNDASTAFIIKKQIVRRYRGGHPRVYIPGTEAPWLSTPTSWNPSVAANNLANYVTFKNAIISGTPSAAGTGTHVNISYYHGFTVYTPPSGRTRVVPTPRATPLIDAIVNYAYVPTPGNQRRRNETP